MTGGCLGRVVCLGIGEQCGEWGGVGGAAAHALALGSSSSAKQGMVTRREGLGFGVWGLGFGVWGCKRIERGVTRGGHQRAARRRKGKMRTGIYLGFRV